MVASALLSLGSNCRSLTSHRSTHSPDSEFVQRRVVAVTTDDKPSVDVDRSARCDGRDESAVEDLDDVDYLRATDGIADDDLGKHL